MLQVPVERLTESRIQEHIRPIPKLSRSLAAVDGVPAIVTGAILNETDQ